MNRTHRTLLGMAALTSLAAVFTLYTRPDFLMQLANQVWACI